MAQLFFLTSSTSSTEVGSAVGLHCNARVAPAPDASIKRCCRIAYAPPAYFYRLRVIECLSTYRRAARLPNTSSSDSSIVLIGPGDTNGFFQWVSTCFQPSRGVCVEPLAGRGLTFGPILAEQVHLQASQFMLIITRRFSFVIEHPSCPTSLTQTIGIKERCLWTRCAPSVPAPRAYSFVSSLGQ